MIDKDAEMENLGQNDSPLLPVFRKVGKSYALNFKAMKDNIKDLLGSSYNHESGIFREGILKEFLTRILPKSISIDSGFIFGFERVKNSDQLDIILWDSSKHAAVYAAKDFVIVSPESVIAVISVKSTLKKNDIEDGLQNLISLCPLDFAYRDMKDQNGNSILPPIWKFLVSYQGPQNVGGAMKTISDFYKDALSKNKYILEELVPVLREIDPTQPSLEHKFKIFRAFPRQIAAIESSEKSFMFAFGPTAGHPDTESYKPMIKRLPYIYPQRANLTSPLEKVVYLILAFVYQRIGTEGWSLPSAWGDFNPILGARSGDAYEIIEEEGLALINEESLAIG